MVYLSTMVKTDGKMYIMFYYLFDCIKKVKQSPTFQWQLNVRCKQHFCPAATRPAATNAGSFAYL